MASRRDSSSKLLRALFNEARMIKQCSKQLLDSELAAMAGTSFDQLFNFDNDLVHAAASRSSLRLDSADAADAAMLRAFEQAGLDHRDPRDWRTLLSLFAEVHFGKIKTKSVKWDMAALLDLLIDYREVQKKNPQLSGVNICKFLRTDKSFKTKYGRYTTDALRKLVRYARSPKHNVLLRHPEMHDPLLQLFRDEYESKGLVWSPELEATMRRLIDKSVELIDSRNPTDS